MSLCRDNSEPLGSVDVERSAVQADLFALASITMSQLLHSSYAHAKFEPTGSRNNPRAALQDYPGCQMLRDAYRRIHKIPNKTPLSMLYEYASRLNLEVSFFPLAARSNLLCCNLRCYINVHPS